MKTESLPEGCVDLFVAESESSEDDIEGEDDDGTPGMSGSNVWKKVKGRLRDDINDFAASGARPL